MTQIKENITIYQYKVLLILCVCLFFFSTSFPLRALTLENIEGKQHDTNEYIGKGKWTIVNIWGPGCPPCEEEMPELVLFHDEHSETNATVLGIAVDFPSYGYADANRVKIFMEEYLISFPVLLSDHSITEQLGLGILRGLPTTYVFNPEGNVAGMQVGGITRKILEDFIEKHTAKK